MSAIRVMGKFLPPSGEIKFHIIKNDPLFTVELVETYRNALNASRYAAYRVRRN